ncbi:hypothetical protein ABW20_dc0105568 [Dactylellina cionopaga]|nr:hypothetical protein ABW20_dc0105568 [Dactylellina cionopaga]
MVLLTTTLFLSILAAVSAAPAPAPPLPVSLYATWDTRGAIPYLGKTINANAGTLWIGKSTTAYCPLPDKKLCPPGKVTSLQAIRLSSGAPTGSLVMNVAVPGGQYFYIDPVTYLAKWTGAHSASMPKGAITTGFKITKNAYRNDIITGKGNWQACPVTQSKLNTGPWQVFFVPAGKKKLPGLLAHPCFNIQMGVKPVADKSSAWQYI